MKKKVAIIGNFGYKKKQIDGQTFRTIVVKEEMMKNLGKNEVLWVDTSFLGSRPLNCLLKIFFAFKNSENIIIMPGVRGLKNLLPFYLNLKKVFNNKIFYLVVGGWLADFLNQNKNYIKKLNNTNGIYVQTKRLQNDLNNINLENVKILPNFRRFSISSEKTNTNYHPLKLVYFSRIKKEKGIELALEAVKNINEKYKKNNVELYIWGPIESEYHKEFFNILNDYNYSYISYMGFLEPSLIYQTLSKYDVLVFPTYYSGEGFPGAILDSFISGVPVIASNWLDNSEFVDKETGFLFEAKNINSLTEVLDSLIAKPEILAKLSKNCKKQAKKYHVDKIIPDLLIDMKITNK